MRIAAPVGPPANWKPLPLQKRGCGSPAAGALINPMGPSLLAACRISSPLHPTFINFFFFLHNNNPTPATDDHPTTTAEMIGVIDRRSPHRLSGPDHNARKACRTSCTMRLSASRRHCRHALGHPHPAKTPSASRLPGGRIVKPTKKAARPQHPTACPSQSTALQWASALRWDAAMLAGVFDLAGRVAATLSDASPSSSCKVVRKAALVAQTRPLVDAALAKAETTSCPTTARGSGLNTSIAAAMSPSVRQHGASSSSSSPTYNNTTPSSSNASPASGGSGGGGGSRKRAHGRHMGGGGGGGDGDEADDEDGRPPKRPRGLLGPTPPTDAADEALSGEEEDDATTPSAAGGSSSTSSSSAARFACPYYKRNPRKYKSWRICCGPGWATVHRVKEHLYRRHRQTSPVCRRCGDAFADQSGLELHQRAETPCKLAKVLEQVDEMDAATEALLRKKRRQGPDVTETHKWADVYRVLFGEDGEVPSPCEFIPVISSPQVLRREQNPSRRIGPNYFPRAGIISSHVC